MSTFSGRHYPKDVILWAVRWYCRYGVSYRDLEEMLTERGVPVDHTTVYRWVQRYGPELDKRTRWYRRTWLADSWRVDETYVRVGGRWCYLYRAVTSRGDTLDFFLSTRRNTTSAKRFLAKTLRSTAHAGPPRVINTDENPALAAAITQLKAQGQCGHCCIGGYQVVQAGLMRRRPAPAPASRSSFAGFRFPPEVITVAVRWYLRYGLSYRDVEELLAERGITVDHVTVYRWVQRFTPLLIDAARPCRHVPGDRWFVDETYVKVAGRWRYLYRAIDQYGQVIDVLMSNKRDLGATRGFFTRALAHGFRPTEVSTDRAPAYPRVLDEVLPAACHVVEQYGNNPIEADHGRFKARLRPMRGLKRLRSAGVIGAGHAFVQNLRRGHYELGVDAEARHRLSAAFTELALAI